MKIFVKTLGAVLFTIAMAFSAQANEFASPEEAKTMALKAAAHFNAVGAQTAAQDFMRKGGEWHDRDLYVFMQDKNGTVVAHGVKASLVGKNMAPLKDPTGYAFVKDGIMKITSEGWVDYQWQHPATKKVTQKTTYVVALDGGFHLGVGAYK